MNISTADTYSVHKSKVTRIYILNIPKLYQKREIYILRPGCNNVGIVSDAMQICYSYLLVTSILHILYFLASIQPVVESISRLC